MMAKYRKIYQELVDGIRNGIYPAGKLLPGEYELMELYGASRDTIRKALSILSADGYIQRKQGLGSIVLESERISFTLSGLHSFKEETQSLGKEVSTQVITFGKGQPDDRVRTILECDEGEEVWMIERVRTIDHEAIILDMDYLPISLVPALSRDMVEDSLYTCLEETLSMDIAYAKKAITIQEACDELDIRIILLSQLLYGALRHSLWLGKQILIYALLLKEISLPELLLRLFIMALSVGLFSPVLK